MNSMSGFACERFNARAAHEGWPIVCDDPLNLESSRLKAVLEVWNGARGRRAIPRRFDITAKALGCNLEDVKVLDRVEEIGKVRRYRFRLQGRHVASFSGDHIGKYLDEVISQHFIASWYCAYDSAIELSAPLRYVFQYRATNQDRLQVESLVAPFGDTIGGPRGLLTAAVSFPSSDLPGAA